MFYVKYFKTKCDENDIWSFRFFIIFFNFIIYSNFTQARININCINKSVNKS